MANYYEDPKGWDARGVDYDLLACLDYNPQPFGPGSIERVVAVWQGENDGDSWRWVILLTDGRYAYLKGWCDYTGWDCQSGAASGFFEDPDTAIRLGVPGDPDGDDVKAELRRQIAEGKEKTRHQIVGEQMREETP
jgi:hypothetical protein